MDELGANIRGAKSVGAIALFLMVAVISLILISTPNYKENSSSTIEANIFTTIKWIGVENWERATSSIDLADENLENISAEQWFQASRIQSYQHAKALILALKGIIFENQQNIEAAIASWQLALEFYPDPGALIGVGLSKLGLGEIALAEDYLLQASRLLHSDFFIQQISRSRANVGLAQISFLRNESSKAILFATKALIEMPPNKQASYWLAKVYFSVGRYEDALSVLDHPFLKDDVDAIVLKSEVLSETKGYYGASKFLWTTLERPEFQKNSRALGPLLLQIAIRERTWGNISKALKALNLADVKTPGIQGDLRLEERGWIDIRQGKYYEASLKFHSVLQRSPSRYFALLGLAETHFEMGNLLESYQLLNYLQAATRNKKLIHKKLLSWVHFFRGRYFDAVNDGISAESEYLEAVSLYGKNNPARIRVGNIYIARGDCRNALSYFREVLNIDSKNGIALSALKKCNI